MAVQKGKEFNITAVLMALAGGGVANLVSDIAEDKLTIFENNPTLASALPSVVGVAGIYFMDDKWKPAFYGMLGASGGAIMDDLNIIDGFSRMTNILPSNMPQPAISPTVNEIALTEEVLSQITGEPTDDEILDEEEI